ncbi:CRISPR-associated protein Cas4 [Enterococcus termitis]|uniref:CRISPR-associated exonuclease Cas4 n=1 Tax=Enterococcus termitis TaxID=332950 RepID=A0A1E5G9W8_9ENTE|nr:CRISPR-associated protein Cas4 [Enterococcus termitis]OEG09060.1 CRISPR-associated protein Cas4 [Enterococcus termitis]OJG98508.1 CRISPR-associated protein cas4 [Enterococcus termitis]
MYDEQDYLMISGIQHFLFCRRQWALIHIEQQWQENVLTLEGQYLHEKADQPMIREKRHDRLIVRGLPIHSPTYGLSGICDVVEFIQDPNGVTLAGETGTFLPVPVEYKHGKPKQELSDILQLTAQAVCLEEMLVCDVPKGYLYYHGTKRREEIEITTSLRNELKTKVAEMHQYWERRYTPKVKTGNFCKKCSLQNICLPKLMNVQTVKGYLDRRLRE